MIINTSFYFSGQYERHSHPKNRAVFVYVQGMKSDGQCKNLGNFFCPFEFLAFKHHIGDGPQQKIRTKSSKP